VYKELLDGCLITENFPYVFQQELNNTNDNDFFNLFIGEMLDEFTEPNCIVRVEVQLNEKNVIVMN